MSVDPEKLVSLLLAEEGHEQGLALVETMRDEIDWEDLMVRVTAHGHPYDRYPIAESDNEGFRPAFRLTLGRFEPLMNGTYRRQRIAQHTNLVLRLLALSPPELEVRREPAICIDGNDGVIDADALVRAFPELQSLALARCELDDWDALSRMQISELRMWRCRRFAGRQRYACTQLGVSETHIAAGTSFAGVTRLVMRGGIEAKALRQFRSLRTLRHLGSSCYNELITAMATLPELEVVDVDGTVRATERGTSPVRYVGADLAPFRDSPKIRELRLRGTLVDVHRLHPLLGHPTLEVLELDAKLRRKIPKQVRRDLPLVSA